MRKQYNEVRNRKSEEESLQVVHLPQYKLSSTDQDYSKLAILNNNLEYLEEEISYTTSSLKDLLTKYKAYDRQLDFTLRSANSSKNDAYLLLLVTGGTQFTIDRSNTRG